MTHNAFAPTTLMPWNEMKSHFTYDEFRQASRLYPKGPKGMTTRHAHEFVESLKTQDTRNLLKWRNVQIQRVMASLYPHTAVRCKELEEVLNRREAVKVANGVPSADGWIDEAPTSRRWVDPLNRHRNSSHRFEYSSNSDSPIRGGWAITQGPSTSSTDSDIEGDDGTLSHDRRITQTSSIQQSLVGLPAPVPVSEAEQIKLLTARVEKLQGKIIEMTEQCTTMLGVAKTQSLKAEQSLKEAHKTIENLEMVYEWDVNTHHRGASKVNFLKYTKGHVSLELYIKCGGNPSEY